MTSIDCSEISITPLTEWREIDDEQDDNISDIVKKTLNTQKATIELCKHKGKVSKHPKTSFISIVTGIAIIALGLVLEPVTAGGSTALIGLGGSLIGNAMYEEMKQAGEPQQAQTKPPEQFDSSIKPQPVGC